MKKLFTDDMILTKDIPTTAGSKMLDGYVSLFEAEALTRLTGAGYTLEGKCQVGEFAIDLLGETSYKGAIYEGNKLVNPLAKAVCENDAIGLALDVNGSVRRAAAQSGLVSVKPTYGTVSRYGTVPVACSGETVSVIAKCPCCATEALRTIAGHDDKDGTSLPEAVISASESAKKIEKIALLKSMTEGIDSDTRAKLDAAIDTFKKSGVEVVEIDDNIICLSKIAWNTLMSAELCNNVSRYDGVKYGYRAESFSGIDELYTNSRTEAFGELLKTAIIFGSETLSTDNYMKVYDKALRTRRVIAEEFAKLFESFDAILMPATSKMAYTKEFIDADNQVAFEENFYTAPASVTGLPAVVSGGVQLIGKAFSEYALLDAVKVL